MPSILQTPTPNLSQSIAFYEKLNYQIISKENPTLVSNGKVVIEINPSRFARAGVKLYRPSWEAVVKDLEDMTTLVKTDTGYVLSDPSGVWIYLETKEHDFEFTMEKTSFGVTGNFAGLSLETTDVKRSCQIWEQLGFTKTMGSIEQGWITYENVDGLGVSLMKPMACPHLFLNPSMTFFNGKDNLAIIEKIRQLEVPIVEEITHFNKEGIVDNILIQDPGGFGFFIFND